MKLNFFSIITLMTITSAVLAGTAKMPPSEVIMNRLRERGFSYLAEKTTLVEDLANKELEALGIEIVVETALVEFNEYMNDPMIEAIMQMNKPKLFEALLQDSPEILQELEEKKLV